jgi:hypothetical protein
VVVLRFCQAGPAGTGLTSATHWSDRCSPVVLELLVPLRSRVGVGDCWFLGLIVSSGYMVLANLGS